MIETSSFHTQRNQLEYLNIGCGHRFHHAWQNIDFISSNDKVSPCDLRDGIPFRDSFFQVVYHSHLLEHFSKESALRLTKECFRVIKPRGIIRIVVPDLEAIVNGYLFALDQVLSGNLSWDSNYEWMLLELFDQMIRNSPGGGIKSYFQRKDIPNENFVVERMGSEIKNIAEEQKKVYLHKNMQNQRICSPKKILRLVHRFFRYPIYRREYLLKLILGQDYKFLEIGRFRQSGEIHQWMYDRYSLRKLLNNCGFIGIVQRTAKESYIPNWESFNLDTEPDGSTYKPYSLFMEAIKPGL
ncbi:Methyltransferase domain protein [Halomicronema hongdechloris C2206]|uniref:Methyltransferase domain protein n=1 Tax=Halomicronema hongdechloris C2206 TaxID=1641165 RepID=A0A1Z3HMD0_9CYAN|nr:methyltransferase domain-containing protein [Halomicronema hongdechloris]ASC71435.1 Methyltransferase domain protein [Halomicronema hongdechloris C2206]